MLLIKCMKALSAHSSCPGGPPGTLDGQRVQNIKHACPGTPPLHISGTAHTYIAMHHTFVQAQTLALPVNKRPPTAPFSCTRGQCVALPRNLICLSRAHLLLCTLPASHWTAFFQDSPCLSTIPTLLAMSTTSSRIAPGCLVAWYPANLRAICACKNTCGAGAHLTACTVAEEAPASGPSAHAGPRVGSSNGWLGSCYCDPGQPCQPGAICACSSTCGAAARVRARQLVSGRCCEGGCNLLLPAGFPACLGAMWVPLDSAIDSPASLGVICACRNNLQATASTQVHASWAVHLGTGASFSASHAHRDTCGRQFNTRHASGGQAAHSAVRRQPQHCPRKYASRAAHRLHGTEHVDHCQACLPGRDASAHCVLHLPWSVALRFGPQRVRHK